METLAVQLTFFIIAALMLFSATMVVTVKNIIHAALWLISTFFGIGMLYLLLQAEFLAVAQVLIYVGAVSVLTLFAIMVTRQVTGGTETSLYPRWWLSLLIVLTLFGAVIVPTFVASPYLTPAPAAPPAIAGPVELGTGFMREYLLPFQAAAVLLLIALVGAIVIAYEERDVRRRVLTLAERHALQQQAARSTLDDNTGSAPGNGRSTSDNGGNTNGGNTNDGDGGSGTPPPPTTDDDAVVIRNVER